jgi:hypothetical protein
MGEFFIQSEPSPWTVMTSRGVADALAHPWKTAFGSLAMVRLQRASQSGTPGAFFAALARIPEHPFAPLDDASMHERAISRYVSNKRVTEALAAAYGAKTAFVWKPTPTYKYDLQYHLFKGDFGHHEASGHGYPKMASYIRDNPLGANFIWCADIQQSMKELLYVDSVHYAPRLAERLAGCIADSIVERKLLDED